MIKKTHIATLAGIALFPVTAVSLLGAQVFAAETGANTNNTPASSTTSQKSGFGEKGMKFSGGERGHGEPRAHLSESEQASLESMSDTEKQAFFELKIKEERAKMEAREALFDKLLNGESLTDADKSLVTEIKTERAKMKEEQVKMESIRTKLQNNETLTSEEQTMVDAHAGPKGMKMNGARGEKPTRQ